jgi:hypothetical protein
MADERPRQPGLSTPNAAGRLPNRFFAARLANRLFPVAERRRGNAAFGLRPGFFELARG